MIIDLVVDMVIEEEEDKLETLKKWDLCLGLLVV